MSNLTHLLRGDIESLAALQPVQEIAWPELNDLGLRFHIKRDDQIDPLVSGNKVYKLWGHLQRALNCNARYLVSFGGAYSNHLHALAAAGQALGIGTLAIIRGQRPNVLNSTLRDCEEMGMKLYFVDRNEYRQKTAGQTLKQIQKDYPGTLVVPEGGAGVAGEIYCQPLIRAIESQVEGEGTLCVPCGTATTFKGLLRRSSGSVKMMGFAAVRVGPEDLVEDRPLMSVEIQEALAAQGRPCVTQWSMDYQTARKGFGKGDDKLFRFIEDFFDVTGIPLEPVYTGKMIMRILELARSGFWNSGDNIIALHTGGLQGLRGFPQLEKFSQQVL